jgi:hypothetical protein
MSFCRLSNFAVINDGLLSRSINLSAAVMAMWVAIVKRFSIGEHPLNHYICAGIDPNNGQGPGHYRCMSKKYNSSVIIVIVCCVLHVALGVKIFWFQRREEKRVKPIELGNFNADHQNSSEVTPRINPQSSRPLR